jgi:hypothetical protein
MFFFVYFLSQVPITHSHCNPYEYIRYIETAQYLTAIVLQPFTQRIPMLRKFFCPFILLLFLYTLNNNEIQNFLFQKGRKPIRIFFIILAILLTTSRELSYHNDW